MKAILTRIQSSEYGTRGVLVFDNGFSCKTLELPWQNNKRKVSCIPAGEYHCDLYPSSKFGLVYQIENVPNRDAILIHTGNFAGAKGHKSDVEGCILVGSKFGTLEGQPAILNSRMTKLDMMESTNNEPFDLIIIDEVSKS